jgi:hypothetical protein
MSFAKMPYTVLFALLSINCVLLLPNLHFWSVFKIIQTGNTTKKRQNNAKFVSRDSANARNGFYRSKGAYTRELDVIPAKGAPYWPSIA